jgi:DNA-binding response OmpR family regulator
MRILMVENHATFAQTVVERFLAEHEVEIVASLDAAWRAVSERDGFSTVLVAYDLDDGKGDALVRRLRQRGFLGRIVAISAHEPGNRALLEAGADVACAKLVFHTIAEVLAH